MRTVFVLGFVLLTGVAGAGEDFHDVLRSRNVVGETGVIHLLADGGCTLTGYGYGVTDAGESRNGVGGPFAFNGPRCTGANGARESITQAVRIGLKAHDGGAP